MAFKITRYFHPKIIFCLPSMSRYEVQSLVTLNSSFKAEISTRGLHYSVLAQRLRPQCSSVHRYGCYSTSSVRFVSALTSNSKKGSYSVDEKIQLMKLVFGNEIPLNFEELQTCNYSFAEASKEMKRPYENLRQRWYRHLQPILSEYLYCGSLSKTSRRRDILQFIVDNKFISRADIDEKKLQEKWPFLTKYAISNHVAGKSGRLPLYKVAEIALKTRKSGKKENQVYEEKLQFVEAYEQLKQDQISRKHEKETKLKKVLIHDSLKQMDEKDFHDLLEHIGDELKLVKNVIH